MLLRNEINATTSSYGQDSAFDVWFRSASFSPGVHTLQITKRYTVPPCPQNLKPLQINVPAYELTYNVRYSRPSAVGR